MNKNFDDIENIIMGGDLNCPLNPIIDKRGGNLIPRQAVIITIELLQSELDLHDIWRVKNPTKRSYTWSQSNPLIFLRLDYWLISNSLSDYVCHVHMTSAIKTDHSATVIELQDAIAFFDYINSQHPNICFTMEKEIVMFCPFWMS